MQRFPRPYQSILRTFLVKNQRLHFEKPSLREIFTFVNLHSMNFALYSFYVSFRMKFNENYSIYMRVREYIFDFISIFCFGIPMRSVGPRKYSSFLKLIFYLYTRFRESFIIFDRKARAADKNNFFYILTKRSCVRLSFENIMHSYVLQHFFPIK